jgi:hypothetical protein
VADVFEALTTPFGRTYRKERLAEEGITTSIGILSTKQAAEYIHTSLRLPVHYNLDAAKFTDLMLEYEAFIDSENLHF